MKGLGEGLLVGGVVLVGLPLLVSAVEEAPQEPLPQGRCRAVHLLARFGVVAVEYHAARFAQVARYDARPGDPTDLPEHSTAEIGCGQTVGVCREVPQADQAVRLATSHRLI